MNRALQNLLTVKEVAEQLRFTVTAPTDPEEACRAFLRRHKITPIRRGRINLISPIDIEQFLTKGLG